MLTTQRSPLPSHIAMCPSLPKLLPIPNLTLRLSSNSILDTILINNGAPVFNIETTANRTIVYRCNPWSGQSPVASIEWSAPANFPSPSGPVITIDSVVYNMNTFFKKSVLGGYVYSSRAALRSDTYPVFLQISKILHSWSTQSTKMETKQFNGKI